MTTFATSVGMIGVAIILITYFLLHSGRLKIGSYGYCLANIAGSVMILFSLFFQWNLPSVIIEFAWLAISFYGLYRVKRSRQKQHAAARN